MGLEQIGKRIKKKRLAYSWSQEELAEQVGLSSVYIGMIERGEKIPKLETFIKIINVLKASADEILTDVLESGYIIKTSEYTEKIQKLDTVQRNMIYKIIDAFSEDK